MKYFAIISILSLGTVLATGCSTAPISKTTPSAATVPAGEAVNKTENLPAPHAVCKDIADIDNAVTPPELYDGMVQCAKTGQYGQAAFLFALSGTYSFYDALRVEDEAARLERNMLPHESMQSLDIAHLHALKGEIRKILDNPARLAATCEQVSRIGAPDYYPAYMVRHGANGSAETEAKGGLVKDFDSQASWKEALTSFLHCPAS